MAPSPTGLFHVGSARTALYNWLFARHHNGQFILRIEDTDTARSSEEMIDVIKDGLRWLKIDWDEEYYQSQRLTRYAACARQLVDAKKAYYCYCRPEDLQREKQEAYRNKKDWRYDRRCLHLSAAERVEKERSGIPGAVRFFVPDHPVAFHDVVLGEITREQSNIEDFIILRADGTPTYNLACVIDDHDMKITHVIRGADHVTNTPKQVLLYEALAITQPVFAHLPLILGKDKAKLSKRHGAVSLMEYRDQGFLPEAIFNYLSLLGWSPGDES
jgi:glutamyl-tRNA synthetase